SHYGVQENGTVGGAAVKRGVLSAIVEFGDQGGRRLRIDAVVDPGDSGGPVMDTLGRVVGMSKGVDETTESGRLIVGIFYAVHMEEIETLLAAYEAEATPG
ncbi:MAG: trypsin-like peptidase domain-containing protein, partial [Chloroflexota bacterium]|nr:trypsin-like peptidase domain-containing protein [Chloroflexota bacterium]